MKYRVLGTTSDGQRFNREVFAACAREAEVFVTLRAQCKSERINVAAVLDDSRRTVHCTDMPQPELQSFDAMLTELHDVIRAGNISLEASPEYRWLREKIENDRLEHHFFTHVERRLENAMLSVPGPEVDEESEKLVRLAAIGVSLLETNSVPQTRNLYDLMWQIRATAILYGPVIKTGFRKPHLKIVEQLG